MGLLTEGTPLTPEEMKEASRYIREHGIAQFIATWNRVKNLEEDLLRFGDEIECGIFVVDEDNKTVKLTTRSAEVNSDYQYHLPSHYLYNSSRSGSLSTNSGC